MNKSTLVLVAIATLFLGALIGTGVVMNSDKPANPSAPIGESAAAHGIGGAPVVRFLAADIIEIQYDDFGSALPYALGENFLNGNRAWQQEVISIEIEGDGSVEYKALMDQGDSMSFRWSVDGGQVYYDMHGHDPAFGDDFFTRYVEGEGSEASGSFVAAYGGQHGWYWLNLEVGPVTITLEVAGFFEEIIEIDLYADE